MNVALIKCPWWVRYCPPYILAFLATFLRQHGHTVTVFDLNNRMYHKAPARYRKYWDDRDHYSIWENKAFIATLSQEIAIDEWSSVAYASGARVFCFDTHTPSVLISYEIARKIKEKDKNKIIIFMGHKASKAQMAEDFIRQPFIDYVSYGEIELSLQGLLKKLETLPPAAPLPRCSGFLLKENGCIVDGGEPERIAELDSLPFPDYKDFAADITEGSYNQPNRLDLLDSRGCINACHFCYERLYWKKYRSMSGKRLFEQVQYHIQRFPQINYFYFNGLLLNGNVAALEEFCDLLIKNKARITWAGQAALHAGLSKKLLAKMGKAGCVWLGFGIESGSQRVLNSMNKQAPLHAAAETLKNAKEAGISVQINMMFGFPTETDEDFKASLALLRTLRPYIDNVLASQSFFTLEKETYVRKNPEQFGITDATHHLFWESGGGKNTYAERFRRYEEFCACALSLGLPETSGILKVKPDKWSLLGEYYRYAQEYAKAAECFEKSLCHEGANEKIQQRLAECNKLLKQH